jgi:hypothetical protein
MSRVRSFLTAPVPTWHVLVVACASTVGVVLAGFVR